jgi:hypothetical protein
MYYDLLSWDPLYPPFIGQGGNGLQGMSKSVIESASKPLVDFAILNDNVIKDLISFVSIWASY